MAEYSNVSKILEATVDNVAKKHGVSLGVLSQIGVLGPLDTWMTPHMQDGDMSCWVLLGFV